VLASDPRARNTRPPADVCEHAGMATRRKVTATHAEPGAAPPADAAANGATRRQLILEAAIAEFATKGFAGARIAEIARRSKASQQLIYHYFDNKRGLYEAALGAMIGRLHATAEPIDDDSVSESFRDSVMRMQALSTHPDHFWYRFWMWEALDSGDRDIPREADRRVVFRASVDEVRAAQERGEVAAELDAELLTLAILAVIQFPHLMPQVTKLIVGVKHDSDEFHARQVAMLEQLVERLKPTKPLAARVRPKPAPRSAANGRPSR